MTKKVRTIKPAIKPMKPSYEKIDKTVGNYKYPSAHYNGKHKVPKYFKWRAVVEEIF